MKTARPAIKLLLLLISQYGAAMALLSLVLNRSLFHLFDQEMTIDPYEYITVKDL